MELKDIVVFGAFASFALVFVHKVIRMTVDFMSFSGWRQVEATLIDLDVKMPPRRLVTDSRVVKVRFTYQYGSAEFQGSSVAIPDLAPFPIQQYAASTYQPLEEIYKTTKRMHAWINPGNPDRAVLREVSIYPYAFCALVMAVCFAGAGYFLDLSSLPRTAILEIGAFATVFYLLWLFLSARQTGMPH